MANQIINTRAGKGMNLRRLFTSQNKRSILDKRFQTVLVGCIVALCFATGFAFAQQLGLGNLGSGNSAGLSSGVIDTRLERYSTIVDILDESSFEFSQRPERSRERLALAKETFDLIRQGSGTSGGLIEGLDNTFARADMAITNQSPADFEIQTGLIVGGLQRFLYETATREAQNNNLPLAQAYIKRIVEDITVFEDDKVRLGQAVDNGALQAALEIAAGQSISSNVGYALQALDQGEHQSAYVSLANAYSGFVTVQDSLTIPPSVAPSLINAIESVVAQSPEAIQDVELLQNDLANYIQFNESVLEQFNADLLSQGSQQGLQNRGLDQLGQDQVGLNQANQSNSIQAAVAQELAQQSQGQDLQGQDLQGQGLQGQGLEGQGLQLQNQLSDQASQQGLQGLQGLNQGSGQGQNQALNVPTLNQDRSEGVVTLGAPSLALNDRANSGSIGLGNAGSNNALGNNALSLNGLNSQGSRQQGLGLGQQGANSFDRSSNSRNTMPMAAPEPTFLEGLWSGLPKAIVMLLLALASFVPLYLLQLAFGSGSSHWLWVRLAVFLLLLPIMLEGIAAFGSVLADITGISALSMLSPFTVSGGVIGQLIWAATSLIAIAMLCFGLWGICKQFGLIGQGGEESEAVSNNNADANLDIDVDAEDLEASGSPATELFTLHQGPVGTVMDMGNETVIEWEDEF